MNELHIIKVAAELNIKVKQVEATAAMLADGDTVPFIARYRKEATGLLDEVAITAIRDRMAQLKELDDRRAAIIASLQERNLLTDELKEKIENALTLAVLEDIYLPFRPKRRTRATIAKEKGLEPLATFIFAQDPLANPITESAKYLDKEKGVETAEDALAGARDIIAEWVNEDQTARARTRELFFKEASFVCKVISGKEEEGVKYKNYYDWSEPVATAPSHRVLAMRRGEKETFLTLRVIAPEDQALRILESLFVKNAAPCAQHVKTAVEDCYKRLLSPSMETEIRLATKQKADVDAIKVFTENLRQLLLASPLGQKNVLAIDPGFRTGCKVVCLDRQGKLLHNDVIYPTLSDKPSPNDAAKILALCQRFNIEAIAIGNGTASRETETFVRSIGLPASIAVVMVNESGASVYSASDVAREEFPDCDVTVRGSVSIGRRLMDPLAELVKIDPKSIGVGQYQHDVDQVMLKTSLDDTVVSCVNSVGVEVNTASKQLLTYVSGLGPTLAQNIINYRNENGPFSSRQDLTNVPRLGAKAFQQAAGFLRIREGANPLDTSAVHPESYPIVDRMAKDLNCAVSDLMKNDDLRRKIDLHKYVCETVGLPTLTDIMSELAKPGRDPRKGFEQFQFAQGVEKLQDLKPGLKLPGIVTNITAFGCFVDIGVHQDGLVHISQLSNNFVKDPNEVVKVHQKVTVWVAEVDIARKRIGLTMKGDPTAGPAEKPPEPRREPAKKPAPKDNPRPAPQPPKSGKLADQLKLGWN
ncbi:MAG: RNA-binding transcriptional accessory protein [Planctomycetes bacterium GWF2_50_10]|nr:MAG: RNA-binding transcriptional accessory protein [Planctomycetes bacterium GWF2_50_10]